MSKNISQDTQVGEGDQFIEDFESESPQSHGGCGIASVVETNGYACRQVMDMILEAGRNMEHRGGGMNDQSDGAGIMVRPDPAYFKRFMSPGSNLPKGEELVVGNVWFLPEMQGDKKRLQREVDQRIEEAGLRPLGWRKVPVEPDGLPQRVVQIMPEQWHVLMAPNYIDEEDLAKEMYLLRNRLGGEMHGLYFPSFTPGTIVYKTLSTGEQLPRIFSDLRDPDFKTSGAVFHRRYSTNTTPKFPLAQPFSMLAHNGEINTNPANVNAVHDFEKALKLFFKVLMRQGSDSANLDRMVELFTALGVPLEETLRRFMMPPWKDNINLTEAQKAYYEGCRRALGNLAVMEGPAAVTALTGDKMVASLDKMGLRPLRVVKTKSGFLVVASELGAINIPPEDIEYTYQLSPGEIMMADTTEGKIYKPGQVESHIVANTPINFRPLSRSKILVPEQSAVRYEFIGKLDEALTRFGWTAERKRAVMNMLKEGKEPITSMGNGRPLAILSQNNPTLFKYFKQIVAVVTNPPIDPLREKGAFDLTTYLGRVPGISEVKHDYKIYEQYKLESPFLTDSELKNIMDNSGEEAEEEGTTGPKTVKLDLTFERGSADNLKARLNQIRDEAISLVKSKKAQIIVLSDSDASDSKLPVSSLLAVSMINNALKEQGLRRNVSLVCDTGEIQEVHDAAVLFAHGANAVNPRMMWHVAYADDKGQQSPKVETLRNVLDAGLRKIMSKMGITTLDGYRDSQLFEAIGLGPFLRGYYLKGTASHIGGIGIEEVYEDICARSDTAGGLPKDKDKTVYRRDVYEALHEVARGEDPGAYEEFLKVLGETPPTYLRDLLTFKKSEKGIEKEQVTPREEIIAKVFRAAAMSHGALNKLAHMAIAGAFNSFGAMSNSGEGGEMDSRSIGGENEEARSKIRQVASGRFGVDADYLVGAEEIQIKIGQGAKPGEGGHLPSHKVTAEIAGIRKTQTGIDLISPPPHHSIYSIEDLAQLIYNVKQVNPTAKVSVKVPSITNLGTIAIGILKAGADAIEISCFSGGTGAATESSIEHAGIPLERSLAEVHQVLIENGVRDLIKIRADGGIKSGMDVAKLIALGADETSFGSVLMVAEDCVMCRGCSKGKCPAGIATSDEAGEGRFMKKVKPDLTDPKERYEEAKKGIQNYLLEVSEEFRQILADLGIEKPEDLRGRVDLLEKAKTENPRHDLVDLKDFLRTVEDGTSPSTGGHVQDRIQNRIGAIVGETLDDQIIADLMKEEMKDCYDARNTNLTIGGKISGMMARGEIEVKASPIIINLKGYAGQALGFAAGRGLKIVLEGYANDAVGEAMSGTAHIVIKQPKKVDGARSTNSVIGNAACYGATGGALYVEGSAGHRLGVRNSGALIVTEGAGKYAFEYMTGGAGVVLGQLGEVVGAGMTGGVLICRDPRIEEKIHHESVEVQELSETDYEDLIRVLTNYSEETESPLAANILQHWEEQKHTFKKVVPKK